MSTSNSSIRAGPSTVNPSFLQPYSKSNFTTSCCWICSHARAESITIANQNHLFGGTGNSSVNEGAIEDLGLEDTFNVADATLLARRFSMRHVG